MTGGLDTQGGRKAAIAAKVSSDSTIRVLLLALGRTRTSCCCWTPDNTTLKKHLIPSCVFVPASEFQTDSVLGPYNVLDSRHRSSLISLYGLLKWEVITGCPGIMEFSSKGMADCWEGKKATESWGGERCTIIC